MKHPKTLLIGIGDAGTQTIDKLVSDGVRSTIMMVQDSTKPPSSYAPTFSLEPYNPEHESRLEVWIKSEIDYLALGADDLVLLIDEMGSSLSQAMLTILFAIQQTNIDIAVIGIMPQPDSPNYQDSLTDAEYLVEECQSLIIIQMDEAAKDIKGSYEVDVWEHTIDYACHATDLFINARVQGLQRVSGGPDVNTELLMSFLLKAPPIPLCLSVRG